MSTITFCKFHGFGNDYIVIEKAQLPAGTDLAELGKAICDRHRGAGADGIAIVEKLDGENADYFCEIVNPDGSIAGFSGNGTRCAVSYLYHKGLWPYPELRLETRSGVKRFTLVQRENDHEFWFEAEIGEPKFTSREIPFHSEEPMSSVRDVPVHLSDGFFLVSCVNVGNPVACSFVDDFNFDWRKFGAEMESHPIFPERANIVFVKVLDRENIEIRIWERGAHETSASGTAASGSAVLSAFTGRTERTVSVISPGGTTEVHWREDGEMLLTGKAEFVYCGTWPVK